MFVFSTVFSDNGDDVHGRGGCGILAAQGVFAQRGRGRGIGRGRAQGRAEVAPMVSANGTAWRFVLANERNRGRAAMQNILRQRPGPTVYATRHIQDGSPSSAFGIFFNERMRRHIKNCTEVEGRRVTGNNNWELSLQELDNFIGLVIGRGLIGGRTTPVYKFWSTNWGNQLFINTMRRDRFAEILRFIRFDLREERRRRLETDRFALVSQIWNIFIENCRIAYNANTTLTVDEQLLPCKCRCPFIQYISNKPDKFGIKFWLLVDANSKYLLNGFPYLGRENIDDNLNASVPSRVVLKLAEPFQNSGHHIAMDNYFTSLDLAQRLQAQGFSLLGTVRHNRRDMPPIVKTKLQLHVTKVLKPVDSEITLTHYQCKAKKSVLLLSSLHRDVQVPRENNPKNKPETVLQYNKEKVGVDILDKMLRNHSTKVASRRWPMHVFHNIIDMSVNNGWIVYKEATHSTISRRKFIEMLVEEMTHETPNQNRRRRVRDPPEVHDDLNAAEPHPVRKQCRGECNKNRTTDRCRGCNEPVCGKCSTKFCSTCMQ